MKTLTNDAPCKPCESYDELLRLIGKTLLHFQQLELLMKWVLAIDSIKIFHGDTDDVIKKRMHEHESKTMGDLIEIFLKRICVANPSSVDLLKPSSKPEPIIRMGILMGVDPEAWRPTLLTLKNDRNKFVHHFLSAINPCLEYSVKSHINDLTGLIDRLKPVIQHLKNLANSTEEFIRQASEKFSDPDFVAINASPPSQMRRRRRKSKTKPNNNAA